MMVSGNLTALAVKWDKPLHGHPSSQGQRQTKNKPVPIIPIGLTGHSDEGVTREVSAKDGQADGPAGQRSSRGHEIFC